jgi:hypothetical protein
MAWSRELAKVQRALHADPAPPPLELPVSRGAMATRETERLGAAFRFRRIRWLI